MWFSVEELSLSQDTCVNQVEEETKKKEVGRTNWAYLELVDLQLALGGD